MNTVHLIPFALAPVADRFNGSPSTDRIRHPGTGNLFFAVIEGAGGTGTAAITVNCYAAASGGSGTAIAFEYKTVTGGADFDTASGYTTATSSGVTPTAGATKATLVKIRYDQVTEGKPFVELTLTEGDSTAVDAAVIAFCDDPPRPGAGVSLLS
jgi:hypothetical protein